MERIFLDANVLFSAAYLENSGLSRLWQLQDVELMSSTYAIEEARRNLMTNRAEASPRFNLLLELILIIDPPQGLKLPQAVRLDLKDHPILLAAIRGRADYLLTGDVRHFQHLYGKRIEGVMVVRPAQYFERRRS